MKFTFQKTFGFLILAVYLAALAGLLVLVVSFRQESLDDHRSEELTNIVREKAQELNGLEWQAIAKQSVDADLKDNIENQRSALVAALDSLAQLNPDEMRLTLLNQLYADYQQATDEELGLISSGRMKEALAIDEERTDPLFAQIDNTAADTIAVHSDQALRESKTSYVVIAVAGIASLFFTSFLIWIYYLILRKHRQVSTEKEILMRSEERFRSVAQSANEAIITVNERGAVTYWNPAATSLFGYEEDEALGRIVSFIIPERFRKSYLARMKRAAMTGETRVLDRIVELSGLKKDGTEFPVDISLSMWQVQQESFFTAIIRDISMRRQVQQQLASQANILEQRNLQLTALFDIGLTISRTMELHEILDQALERIAANGVLNVQKKGGILLVTDSKMTLVSHLGHPEEFLARHKEIAMGECLCGLAMESGEIITSEDSSNDGRHSIRYAGMEPHGHVIVPLKAKDRVVGVMYLYTKPGTFVDGDRKRLFTTIGGQLGVAIENARLFEKTKELSLHDPLTGLANRSFMNIELRKNFILAKRKNRPLSLIMLDLDNFKNYNDSCGHPAGDKLLADIAAIMISMMRETDLVVRYGGEEFLIILPETDGPAAVQIAERIRTTIMRTGFLFAGSQQPSHITVSLGVATYDQTAEIDTEDRIIVMADEALYHAKRKGRNRVEVYESPGDAATKL